MNQYGSYHILCFLFLLLQPSTTYSSTNLENVEDVSTLTISEEKCKMQDTSRIQLNYSFLREKCTNIDKKNKMILEITFDGMQRELFKELPQFEYLEAKNLNFTNISLISSNLRSIDFSNNKLKNFGLRIHEGLERLNVSHNKLTNIELSPINEEKINLKILDMSDNFLLTVDEHSNFVSLKFLNLSNNKIKHIGENFMLKLKYLVGLNMSFNKLSDLHTCTFCSLQSLKNLDLSYNNLKNVDGFLEPLQKLEYLNLDGNKLLNFKYEGSLLTNNNLVATNSVKQDETRNPCCSFKRKYLEKRSVANSHFHVAINNKKLFHNVSSISQKQNTTKLEDGPSIPLKDFFEKLHNLNVENVRNLLNVTFEKIDSSVSQLEHKYQKIMDKLDLIQYRLDSKLEGLNETLNDMVLEISNVDTENSDILNVTLNEIVPKTSFLVNDYENIEFLLTLCVFLLVILVCLAIFRTIMRIRKNRLLKKYRMNLLNMETVP